MGEETDANFEDVLCWLGWWDCPRHGVALIGAEPYLFDCAFSEALDDYPEDYRIWPASEEEVADELDVFNQFAVWRKQLDARHPPYHGLNFVGPAWDRLQQRLKHWPPPDAQFARPEWRLDKNSYSDGPPHHRVRWHIRP